MTPATTATPSTKQFAWMPAPIRTWLISLRPWSFPASLVPVALASALCAREGAVDTLLSLRLVVVVLLVLCLHAGANLANTYCDFKAGVDSKEHSDDRAIVDNHVPAAVVARSAAAFFCASLVAAAHLASQLAADSAADALFDGASLGDADADAAVAASLSLGLGPLRFDAHRASHVATLMAALGALLALGYSAAPIGLKARGLGDATIFLCFGPLLVCGACAAIGAGAGAALLLTRPYALMCAVAVGLHTAAVGHANNARDAAHDRAHGVRSVAQLLGERGSARLLRALLLGGYLLVGAAAWLQRDALLAAPLCAAPWAAHVAARLDARRMRILPQRVAQHNLLFGATLVAALGGAPFAGRLLLTVLFWLGGVNNVVMWCYNVELVDMKLRNVFGPAWSRAASAAAFGGAAFAQTACASLFIAGVQTRAMAWALILFLVPVTMFVHDFWTIEDEADAEEGEEPLEEEATPHKHGQHASAGGRHGRSSSSGSSSSHKVPGSKKAAAARSVASRDVANFPTEFDNEFVHFFKNFGIIGGLALYANQ